MRFVTGKSVAIKAMLCGLSICGDRVSVVAERHAPFSYLVAADSSVGDKL